MVSAERWISLRANIISHRNRRNGVSGEAFAELLHSEF